MRDSSIWHYTAMHRFAVVAQSLLREPFRVAALLYHSSDVC